MLWLWNFAQVTVVLLHKQLQDAISAQLWREEGSRHGTGESVSRLSRCPHQCSQGKTLQCLWKNPLLLSCFLQNQSRCSWGLLGPGWFWLRRRSLRRARWNAQRSNWDPHSPFYLEAWLLQDFPEAYPGLRLENSAINHM